MAHYLAIRNSKPSAIQKRQIIAALKAFDTDLRCTVGTEPGQAAFYVEAPDYYGSSDQDTREKCEKVRAIVTAHMGAK